MSKTITFILCGIGAGIVNGLLGTGGGIVLIFALSLLNTEKNNKDVYALTLSVTLVLSAVSLIFYCKKGGFDFTSGLKYVFPACVGGYAGAYLLDRLKGNTVKKIFAYLVIFAGANMAGIF